MTTSKERAADALLMAMFGSRGTQNQAKSFLMERARYNSMTAETVRAYLNSDDRVFIPPKPADRVVMFADKSGVYVHEDGFVTPMGDNISYEIHSWTEDL